MSLTVNQLIETISLPIFQYNTIQR